jgi:hypothetical protein
MAPRLVISAASSLRLSPSAAGVVKLLWTMVGLDPDGAATVTASWLARAGGGNALPPVGRLLDLPEPGDRPRRGGGSRGQGELTWHNGTGTGISHYVVDASHYDLTGMLTRRAAGA